MYILHGTWVPETTDNFVQAGQFCLWVETEQPHSRRRAGIHPYHLKASDLAQFLSETLGLKPLLAETYIGRQNRTQLSLEPEIVARYFLLPTEPTDKGWALPSWEMSQYLETEIPETVDWQYWQIACYPVQIAPSFHQRVCNLIKLLNELHFLTQHRLTEVQMGTDLLFWYHYTQAFKQVILRDQYIPALKYRSTPPVIVAQPEAKTQRGKAKRASKAEADGKTDQDKTAAAESCEIYPGWEIVSERYETLAQTYGAQLPPFCSAGFSHPPPQPQLHQPELLLRHFSEVLLTEIVVHTPRATNFYKQIDQTLLQNCLDSTLIRRPWSGEIGLTLYRQWREWRDRINQSQTPENFILAFQLREPLQPEDLWQLAFQVAPSSDSSRLLSLLEYWRTPPKQRQTLGLGDNFEQGLLLHLGYAARIYTKLWQGLETDQPSEVYLPLDEAFDFLQETAWVLEEAGYRVIIPAWWTPKGRQRARVRLRAGLKSGSASTPQGYFSADQLIAYNYELSLGGQTVSQQEWQQLIHAKAPLVQFRGQWVLLDRDKMQQMLEFWQKQQAEQPELTLTELIRLSSTANDDVELATDHDQALAEMLQRLREKASLEEVADPTGFQGSLRPYQRRGVGWLAYLEMLGLNGCLADDMGMGKSAQVIARLVHERNLASANPELIRSSSQLAGQSATKPASKTRAKTSRTTSKSLKSGPDPDHPETPPGGTAPLPTLLIAPTSVVGNWGKEIEKFAPHLRFILHHGAERVRAPEAFKASVQSCDLVITSYTLVRLDEALLSAQSWQRIVIDEAQNIKNPKAAQTKAILKLSAQHRLALTGTPVENRLLDLWSIFNFLNPGYLGKESQFRSAFEVPIQRDHNQQQSVVLKKLVEPFILRRVKTDPAIISDLPDKVEQKCYCNLTKEQAALYEVVVQEVNQTIETVEGIQRKGMILATLMKLKQICNHPAQFLHDNSDFTPARSQKLERLLEMVDEVMAAGESLLIFSQFTEIGESLESLFRHRHYNTYYLHGGVARKKREQMITAFQDPETDPSIFILSLKAGGVGITLTKANHVFHFDRWWNPAVENQATDRAFRIGQTKNVFVHKFIALGTLEEKIDQMIEDKQKLAGAIVGNDESWLSTLDNDAFRKLIALNRKAVVD